MRTRLWMTAALLAACGDDPKSRLDTEDPEAGPPDATLTDTNPPDAAPPADQGPGADSAAADARPPDPDDSVPPPDAAIDRDGAVAPPDQGNGTPEVCNGLDDDADGEIDEEVANLCGGCGPVPAEGCQAWRIDLTQTADEAQTLNPNRVVGLQGTVTSFVERDIDGAHCVFQRALAPGPDAHLGLVTVTTPRTTLTQVPIYDPQRATIRYDNDPVEQGPTQVFGDGEAIEVAAGGGQLVGPFQEALTAPARIQGLSEDDLQGAIDVMRRARVEPATLHWQAAPDAGATLRFFAGGSRPAFNRNVYRAIHHYQLDARLADDGELTLSPLLAARDLPDSSIWVYLRREQYRRLVIGPHAVEISAASRAERRAAGNLEGDEPALFDIVEPSPDVRRITPGEPVTIRWTAPPGDGALVVALSAFDAANLESRYVACEVHDPESGVLVLPPEATAQWPTGAMDDRLLSIRRDLVFVPVQPPDTGGVTFSYSVLLQLEP